MPYTDKQIDYLEQAYLMYDKYTDSRSQILTYLPQIGLDEDQFNEYQISREQEKKTAKEDTLIKGMYEERAEQHAVSPYHSQTPNFTDKEIVELFDRKAELESIVDNYKMTDEEFAMLEEGIKAEKEYDELYPYYSNMMESEREDLRINVPGFGLGIAAQMAGGWTDFLQEGPVEGLHETLSWNPFTAFGLFDIAEFQTNPEGGLGFSQELKDLESALGLLTEKQKSGSDLGNKYRDKYIAKEELKGVRETISEHKLINPKRIQEWTEESK